MRFPGRIFVTGTDTGIGKTVVSAILLAGLGGRYWKPIQSGLEEMTDTQWIKEATGRDEACFIPETFRLNKPLSPHASAEADGVRIALEDFRLPRAVKEGPLIIEGAGGILVPLNETALMIDLIRQCDAPVLIVARSGLGTINHTLLTISQLQREKINILGVVMNGPRNPINRRAIEHYSDVRVLGEIEALAEISPKGLKDAFNNCFGQNCHAS